MKKSNHAQVAQTVKKVLKKRFPGVKFSVRSAIYAGGSSVYIDYKDKDLDRKVVDAIVEKFQSGFFDGMTDTYHYYENRTYPTVRWVLISNLY